MNHYLILIYEDGRYGHKFTREDTSELKCGEGSLLVLLIAFKIAHMHNAPWWLTLFPTHSDFLVLLSVDMFNLNRVECPYSVWWPCSSHFYGQLLLLCQVSGRTWAFLRFRDYDVDSTTWIVYPSSLYFCTFWSSANFCSGLCLL